MDSESPRGQLLLVEDDPVQAHLAQALLGGASGEFDVVHAERFTEARRLLKAGGMSCVLLDLQLPDMSGIDTLLATRAAAPHVPIVVYTARDDEALALRALECGAQDYVVKGDTDGGALSRAIRFAVSRQRSWDPMSVLDRAPEDGVDELPAGLRDAIVHGELQDALSRDELVLHYQPQVDLFSGKLVGVEALMRWQHPTRGLLFPDFFIPVAERSGLIRLMTDWALRAALEQRARWGEEGLHCNVAVNMSPSVLAHPDLPAALETTLAVTGVSPSALTVEVTEDSLMARPAVAQRALTAVAGMGVAVSLDDFGTGYSSLSYLKRLPIDELKIDKSFVLNLADDPHDATIVRATIDLAHRLGKTVVAEGVESDAARQLLVEFGCDAGQGYHWSRPLPAADLASWAAAFGHISGSGGSVVAPTNGTNPPK